MGSCRSIYALVLPPLQIQRGQAWQHALEQLLEALRAEEAPPFNLILLPGDLTEGGLRAEFAQAVALLTELSFRLGLSTAEVVFAPGSHDVNRLAAQAYFLQQEANEQTPQEPYWPKLTPYADFCAAMHPADQTGADPFSQQAPFESRLLPRPRLAICSINATLAISHREADQYAYIGEAQSRHLAERLRSYEEQGLLRIGLSRPALLDDPPQTPRSAQDIAAFLRILAPRLNLLVTGPALEERANGIELHPSGVLLVRAPRASTDHIRYRILRISAEQVSYGGQGAPPEQMAVSFSHVTATFAEVEGVMPRAAELADAVAAYRRQISAAFQPIAFHHLAQRGEDRGIDEGAGLLSVFVPQRAQPDRLIIGADGAQEVHGCPITEILFDPQRPWVFLLGEPGAGKTTLCRYLALRLCVPGEEAPSLSPLLIPIWIEMRGFHARAIETSPDPGFLDYAAETIPALGLSRLRVLAESGRLLWIFDGLDEVMDGAARLRYAQRIAALAQTGLGRGVITSRLAGGEAPLAVLKEAGVPSYRVAGFTNQQIEAFLARWHSAVFAHEPEVGIRRLTRIRAEILATPGLRDLCRSPLLLTLLCLLNRGGELPRRRHQIYRRALDLMASDWDANKHLGVGAPRFDHETKLRFLKQLAWHMMAGPSAGAENRVGEEALLAFAARFCEEEGEVGGEQTPALAGGLLASLRERGQVLVPAGGHAYGFLHRAFLEYLAADEMRSRFATQRWDMAQAGAFCAARYHDESWEEVLALFCGMLDEDRPAHVMNLVQEVLRGVPVAALPERVDFPPFAVRCLGEVRSLGQEPLARFAERLTALILAQLDDLDGLCGRRLLRALRGIGPRWPGAALLRHFAMQEAPGRGQGPARALAYRMALMTSEKATWEAFLQALYQRETDLHVRAEITEEVLAGILAAEDDSRIEEIKDSVTKVQQVPLALADAHALYDAVQQLILEIGWDLAVVKSLPLWLKEPGPVAGAFWTLVMQACQADTEPSRLRSCLPFALMALKVDGDDLRAALREFAEDPRLLQARELDQRGDREAALALIREIQATNAVEILPLAAWLIDVDPSRDLLWRTAAEQLRIALDHAELDASGQEQLLRWLSFIAGSWPATGTLHPRLDSCFHRALALSLPDDTAVVVAALAARLEQAPELAARGREVLRRLAARSGSEYARCAAAAMLARLMEPDAEWRPTLLHLAHGAQNEGIRLLAARRVEDSTALADLAASAQFDIVRPMAAQALQAYQLKQELLRIGRPRRGIVYLENQHAGVIEEIANGTRFTYDAAWLASPDAEPISLTLPLRAQPYETEGLHPFFANLLPEGWYLDLATRKLRLDRRDAFGLLLGTCQDNIGAVSVRANEEDPRPMPQEGVP